MSEIEVDLQGRVQSVSPQALAILGQAESITPGVDCFEAFSKHPALAKALLLASQNRKESSGELRLADPAAGALQRVRYEIRLVRNASGQFSGIAARLTPAGPTGSYGPSNPAVFWISASWMCALVLAAMFTAYPEPALMRRGLIGLIVLILARTAATPLQKRFSSKTFETAQWGVVALTAGFLHYALADAWPPIALVWGALPLAAAAHFTPEFRVTGPVARVDTPQAAKEKSTIPKTPTPR